MLFNSYEFIFAFLPLTFFVYFWLNSTGKQTAGKVFLVAASLFFYSWWNVLYLPLIVGSILFNYFVGLRLCSDSNAEPENRKGKILLAFSIAANLSLLGYFKYADFFIENVNSFAGADISVLNLALPLAISFFTFQQIAYLVDCYRNEVKDRDFINYAVFVCFFPQLIAGPIVHNREMMPQFSNIENKVLVYRNISIGIFVFSIGLFKKVVIADTFSTWATTGFDISSTLQFIEAWVTSLSYTFQLYFDFSGYTDMAVGIALLFNIKLPKNFYSPYKATNIQDFWRRWHITLSRFLRDYLYIPLGGNRLGEIRTYTNLMTTFILGGLWHGAGWTFVFWGLMHGVALAIHRAWSKIGIKLWSWLGWLLTFNFVVIAWVFFRAKEWADAIKVLKGMFGFNGVRLPDIFGRKFPVLSEYGVEFGNSLINIRGNLETLLWVFCALIFVLVFKNTVELRERFVSSYFTATVTVVALTTSVLMLNKVSEFLYFNF